MDTTAPFTPRQVTGLTRRMLDAGREPEFIIAYLVQRGGRPGSVRAAVDAVVDRRRAEARTRRLRRAALVVESLGAVLTLLGAGAAWQARGAADPVASPWMGPAVVLAGVGYLVAWRGLLRGLAAGRRARDEVRRQRSLLGNVQV